jgi:hypothetical protein
VKNFMFLFRGGRHPESPAEMQAQMAKWMGWIERLQKEGQYLAGDPLEPGGKVVTSPRTITDGPFAEGKELVGGYFLVRAATLDEAAAMARDCPIFENGGSVEVRPVQIV